MPALHPQHTPPTIRNGPARAQPSTGSQDSLIRGPARPRP